MTDTRPVLVAYSSGTGNTEAVARAIAGSIPGSVLRKASEAGDLSAYRLVLLGFWIDMGVMSADAKAVMGSASALRSRYSARWAEIRRPPGSSRSSNGFEVRQRRPEPISLGSGCGGDA